MAALASSSAPASQPKGVQLKDAAATAALYAQAEADSTAKDPNRFLDSNHKLSSAGAAASLKYARPEDLPSYPSSGLKKNDSSAAGAAAAIGWKNQKDFEHWKPDASSAAAKAASDSWDYKMAPLWQPQQSASGAKAALLAHRDGKGVEIWKPEPNNWGNSAATQAFKTERSGTLSPQVDYGYTDLGRKGSMMAATGAMAGSRKRAESSPIVQADRYPDESNAVANALSAATSANKPSRKAKGEYSSETGAVPFTNMSREMYTSNPPVAPEVEEKNRQNTLRASAVAMAQSMYKLQQKQIDEASRTQSNTGLRAAASAHGRRRSNSDSDDEVVPMKFNNLQEAAQKLAHERLAKLHDEHAQNREYRDYYASGNAAPSSRTSLRGKPRRRASSDGNIDDDKKRSQNIRAQMSLFSSKLSQVDSKKRQMDREALMAAAQRNVTKSMQGMDEKVFAETGKVSPAMMSEWELKAQAAAQKNSDSRMANHGRVNIGGGMFMSQSAVDLIARKNVQPVLDEISEKAEAQRLRDAEIKLEQERIRREAEEKKTRENEVKEVNKKLKAQDKEEERAKKAEEKEVERAKKAEEKEAERVKKAEEKAVKDEAKRVAKEEKRKSKETKTLASGAAPTSPTSPVEGTASPESEDDTIRPTATTEEATTSTAQASSSTPAGYQAPANLRTSMELQQQDRLEEITHPNDGKEEKKQSWFSKRFSLRSSRGQKSESKDVRDESDKSFVGGATYTGASAASLEHHATADDAAVVSDVEHDAEVESEERAGRSKRRASSISKVSAVDGDLQRASTVESSAADEYEEARDHFNEDLAPPPTFQAEKSSSPVRESKFQEVI